MVIFSWKRKPNKFISECGNSFVGSNIIFLSRIAELKGSNFLQQNCTLWIVKSYGCLTFQQLLILAEFGSDYCRYWSCLSIGSLDQKRLPFCPVTFEISSSSSILVCRFVASVDQLLRVVPYPRTIRGTSCVASVCQVVSWRYPSFQISKR